MNRPVEFASAVEGRQDRVSVFAHPQGLVAVVADGAGGIGGGAEAAQAVVDAVAACGWCDSSAAWLELLAGLDGEISPGEATAVIASVGDSGIFGASVGDSEAWWFSEGKPRCLTEAQQRKPLVGSGASSPVAFELDAQEAGTLVLGSDGLWKYARVDLVAARLVLPPEAAAPSLIELVRYPGGSLPDDVSVALCRIGPASAE